MSSPSHGTGSKKLTRAERRRPGPKSQDKEITERDLQGFKYFEQISSLLERLHEDGTARDKAGNRRLFYDQYASLLLLQFFNPILSSLRSLQQASELDKVKKVLGTDRVSIGALSECSNVFNPDLLVEIIQELSSRALVLEQCQGTRKREQEALKGLTAVDGTFLPCLPRMAWALWRDPQHTGLKIHLHFDVLKGVPSDAAVTVAVTSEAAQFRQMLKPDQLYVIDRGYAHYQLFRDIIDAGSSFVGRVKDNTAFTVQEERGLNEDARAAGIVRDLVVSKLGASHHKDILLQPVRLVMVNKVEQDGSQSAWWLVSDRLDLEADLVALAYRYRWTIELFFRWLKCILGFRHLLAENPNGVAIQCYAALIASLLIVTWTGMRLSKRTWEMVQLYLSGWATFDELRRHIDKQIASAAAKGTLVK